MPTRFLAVATAALVAYPILAADPVSAVDPKLLHTAAALFDTLQTETLPNGLRVYLLPVPGAPTVSTMVAYKVGSADEEKDQTGLSHYLEHLLFKGTVKLMPGDIDRATQRNGGRNNAYTSEDMTVYHFDFAADRWKQALEIEADRMRNVRIDAQHEFEQEKGAVVAELKGGEDQPWDLEFKAILPLLFPKASPYSHPVIGQEAHVRAATAEVIKRHYDQWYHPNNAALVVAGGFDPEDARTTIRRLFGSIPKGDLPERKPAVSRPNPTAQVRHEFASKFDVPRMLVGFNTARVGDPEDYVLDIVQDILAGGKTSRLYKALVEEARLANDVGAGNYVGRYPGWFAVNIELLKGKDRAKAEAILFRELGRLATVPVSDVELRRARRSATAGFVFARENVHNLADLTAKAVTHADLDYQRTYLNRLLAVTPDDIQRVATKYLTPSKSVVVWSLPAEANGSGIPPTRPRTATRVPSARSAFREGTSGASSFSLKDARRVVLPNGLTLVMLENHRLPIVVAEAHIRDVRLHEPANKPGVAALLGELLDEGTPNRTGEQIAALIEDTGGSLTFSSTGGSLKVLSPDTDLGLGLLFDCLRNPTFPTEAMERKREQLLSVIADVETQPQNRASDLFKHIVYGDHPYGRSAYGRREIVAKLTAADLKAFHAATFTPDRAIVVVVGDFDSTDMQKKMTAMTTGWRPGKGAAPVVAAPPTADKPVLKVVTDATAAQTHVYIGHLGITRNHPDYYKLLVMDNVLGTGPGFTDRLSANLRDRQGLAYTVRATITDAAGDQPGTFTGYIGTFPDKFLWVRDGFLKEFHRIRDEPPRPQEVEDAKRYLLGSLPFKLTTTAQVASQLLAAERYGLGFDLLEQYRAAIEAVTPADVQAVARKHLDPKRVVIVAVGPITETGEPLKPAK